MTNTNTIQDNKNTHGGEIIKVNPSTNWKAVEKMLNYKTVQGAITILMEPGVYTSGANFKYVVGDILIQRDPAFPATEPIIFQTSNVYREELTERYYHTFFSFERCYRVFIDDIRFEYIGNLDYIFVATYTEFHLTRVQMNANMLIKYGKNVVVAGCEKNEAFMNPMSVTGPSPCIYIEGLCKIFFDERSKDFICYMRGGCEGFSYGSNIAFINNNERVETQYTTNYIESSRYDILNNSYMLREAITNSEGFTIVKEDLTKLFDLIGKGPDK